MKALTDRQSHVAHVVRDLITERGYSPTVREIADRVGLSSTSTILVHLRALRAKGVLNWQPLSPRSLHFVKEIPDDNVA